MKVSCDNCGASYRIPEQKLTKEVSKATCKKCGAKMVIRRADASHDADGSGLSSGFGDDDAPINHDERTVITPMSELGDLAGAAQAPGAVLSQDALGLLGAMPSGRTEDDVPVIASSHQAAPPAARTTRNAEPARATQASAPSGAPLPAQPGAPTPTAPNFASTTQRPDVVNIFAQSQARAQAEAQAVADQQQHSRMPAGLLILALVGLLLFIPGGVWTTVPQTVYGFLLAMYGLLAAFIFHIDVMRTGRVNYVKGLIVPLIPCLGFAAFYYLQPQPISADSIAEPTVSVEAGAVDGGAREPVAQ